MAADALPRAHGEPPATGTLRVEPGDFRVDEELGFAPSGHGEHAFLTIEKCDANTEWVARRLAEAAGVSPMAVGYSGLKDRHAITRQSFSVQLPGRADPDCPRGRAQHLGDLFEGQLLVSVEMHHHPL